MKANLLLDTLISDEIKNSIDHVLVANDASFGNLLKLATSIREFISGIRICATSISPIRTLPDTI